MQPYMHPKVPVVFEYLKRCAHQKRVATYSELGNHVGLAAQGTAMPLHYIQDACWALQLPPITALIVRKSDGLPSTGFKSGKSGLTRREHSAILQQVFAFDWSPIYINDKEDLTWEQQRAIFNLNR